MVYLLIKVQKYLAQAIFRAMAIIQYFFIKKLNNIVAQKSHGTWEKGPGVMIKNMIILSSSLQVLNKNKPCQT